MRGSRSAVVTLLAILGCAAWHVDPVAAESVRVSAGSDGHHDRTATSRPTRFRSLVSGSYCRRGSIGSNRPSCRAMATKTSCCRSRNR